MQASVYFQDRFEGKFEDRADAGSHCGDRSEPGSADPVAPSHSECAGCTLDVAVSSASLDAPATDLRLAFAGVNAWREIREAVVRPGREPPRLERSRPRAVLSITSSLRL